MQVIEDRDLRTPLHGVLDAVEDAAPVEAVEAATAALAEALGAVSVAFLIADLSGRALVRLTHVGNHVGNHIATSAGSMGPGPGASSNGVVDVDLGGRRLGVERASTLVVDDGPAGLALRTRGVQVLAPGTDAGLGEASTAGWTVLAPVTERGESLGLLEMVLPVEPGGGVVAEIARTAHLLGFVVVAGRRHTDLFEWAQRSTAYSLCAEIQRRLLPAAYTCEAGSFALSAWLEPSADVGGDTYDYSVSRHTLHLSITDAMGHGIDSALIATLCVGSLRNSRRHGSSLVEQAVVANQALCTRSETVSTDGYSTGLLARLDLRTGLVELVNAGHVAPYLLRAGAAEQVSLPAQLPLGMFAETPYTSTHLQLQPQDRLVLVTDGMLERNAARLDLPHVLAATRHLHPREATRHLTDLVRQATGQALTDDATLLVVDWHAHHGRDRLTQAGRALGGLPA